MYILFGKGHLLYSLDTFFECTYIHTYVQLLELLFPLCVRCLITYCLLLLLLFATLKSRIARQLLNAALLA